MTARAIWASGGDVGVRSSPEPVRLIMVSSMMPLDDRISGRRRRCLSTALARLKLAGWPANSALASTRLRQCSNSRTLPPASGGPAMKYATASGSISTRHAAPMRRRMATRPGPSNPTGRFSLIRRSP
jgi:hypothetical protein